MKATLKASEEPRRRLIQASAPPPGRFARPASPPCAVAIKLDDREPEAGAAAAARLVGAAEAVERAREEAGGDARPLVGDVELDAAVPRRARRATISPAP